MGELNMGCMEKTTTVNSLIVTGVFGIAMCVTGFTAMAEVAAESADQGNILTEIVVSAARKRNEDVQTTPVAITALNEAMLQQANVTNIADIGGLVPNLHIEHTIATSDATTIYLRGFGTATNDPAIDPHVALFVDGIYQPQTLGTLLDMYDISQVEVLGGPQGTLFGKNAAIGAINITSAPPTGKLEGSLEADTGSYGHFGVRGKLDFPIVDGILAGKVSFVEKKGGNWIDDVTNGQHLGGEDVKAGRLGLAFTPNDNFSWNLTASMERQDMPLDGIRNISSAHPLAIPASSTAAAQPAPAVCGFVGGTCPSFAYGTTGAVYTPPSSGQTLEIASSMNYHLQAVTLTSVTGFYKYWLNQNSDIGGFENDGVPVVVLNAYDNYTHTKQASEEIRVSSNKGGGWDLNGNLDWVLGGYYSNYTYDNDNNLGVLGLYPILDYSAENGATLSKAVFAHGIYHLTDQWSVSAGVRESQDDKKHYYLPAFSTLGYAADEPLSFSNFSTEAGIQYQFDPDRMAYFRFAQGYEAGGFLGFPSCYGCGASYQPEKNNSEEVGFKSDWLEKRLRFNISVFTNAISNLQISTLAPISSPPFFQQVTVNAGKATVSGVEVQLTAVPISYLTTHLNIGYLHTKFDQYLSTACTNSPGVVGDCTGFPFSYAPDWTINPGVDYRFLNLPNGVSATFTANFSYKSAAYLSDPPPPVSRQGGYGLLSAGLKLMDRSEKYSVEVYGTNITNKKYAVEIRDVSGLEIIQTDGRPVEWGVRLSSKFE